MCIYISIIELTTQHINFVFKSQIESQILCVSYSNVVGEHQPAGLKSNLFLIRSAYDESTSLQTSTNITSRGKSFNANKRAVYHSLESGTGYEGHPLISFTILRVHPSVQL